MRNTLFLPAALALVTLAGFGCSPTDRLAEEATEAAINSELGGQANVEIDGDTMRFEDNETGTVSSWGENVEVPSDFPSDVPIYDNGTVVGVTVTREGDSQGSWISFTTSDSAAVAVEWYAERLVAAGWTQQASYSVQGSEMRSFAKGDATITVSAGSDESSDYETVITVIRTNE